MSILELFRKNRICKHEKVCPDSDYSYCPDCGELIENRWFITRCACCGVKLRATIRNGEVVPEAHFCKNCGAKEFVVEKLDKINFLYVDVAVLVKSVVNLHQGENVQSWVDVCTSEDVSGLLPKST